MPDPGRRFADFIVSIGIILFELGNEHCNVLEEDGHHGYNLKFTSTPEYVQKYERLTQALVAGICVVQRGH